MRPDGVRQDRWFVYVARCADGSLYTGIARDVSARIALHNAGKGAKYTRGRGPLVVCATRRCNTKPDALRLELALKALPRARKEELVGGEGRSEGRGPNAGLRAFARRVLGRRLRARTEVRP